MGFERGVVGVLNLFSPQPFSHSKLFLVAFFWIWNPDGMMIVLSGRVARGERVKLCLSTTHRAVLHIFLKDVSIKSLLEEVWFIGTIILHICTRATVLNRHDLFKFTHSTGACTCDITWWDDYHIIKNSFYLKHDYWNLFWSCLNLFFKAASHSLPGNKRKIPNGRRSSKQQHCVTLTVSDTKYFALLCETEIRSASRSKMKEK